MKFSKITSSIPAIYKLDSLHQKQNPFLARDHRSRNTTALIIAEKLYEMKNNRKQKRIKMSSCFFLFPELSQQPNRAYDYLKLSSAQLTLDYRKSFLPFPPLSQAPKQSKQINTHHKPIKKFQKEKKRSKISGNEQNLDTVPIVEIFLWNRSTTGATALI